MLKPVYYKSLLLNIGNQRLLFFLCFFSQLINPLFACNLASLHSNDLFQERKTSSLISSHGIDEAKWNQVLDKIEEIYHPLLRLIGIELFIDRLWSDERVNATVWRNEDQWGVIMYGGYARTKHSSADALAILACHELGHHLGGAPYYLMGMTWASAEGQADFFSTAKCLKKYFTDFDNKSFLSGKKINKTLKKKCRNAWKDDESYHICLRSSLAGYQMNLIWNDGNGAKFSFSRPSTIEVRNTNYRYPPDQCRLDTYLNGALCDPISGTSDKIECYRRDDQVADMRPRCWRAKSFL